LGVTKKISLTKS